MGKKGGGGFDTSALEAATNKSLALQERMYDEGVDRAMPWYTTGVSSQERLADLMGLGGGSMKTRDQLLAQYKPQFTTAGTKGGAGAIFTPSGKSLALINGAITQDPEDIYGSDVFGTGKYASEYATARDIAESLRRGDDLSKYEAMGYGISGGAMATPETVDYDALNAAVDKAYAGQNAPSDFGRLTEAFGLEKFQEDPSYQFRLNEGNKAIERAMAARGKTFTPEAVKALTGYGSDLASTEYANAYNRYNQDQNTLFGRLATLSGYGQSAGAQQSAMGQNFANTSGQLMTNLANAQISAQQAAASRPSMFGQLLGAGAQLGGAYLMSDERVKENIKRVGNEKGYNIYEFNYIGDDKRYIGVMAQEVEKTNPEAILENNGLKRVNYGMLGLSMREVK